MRDALHKTLKPIKDRVGLWWIRFWKWPSILRECYAEISQLTSDLSMVREQFRTGQSIRETLEKIANESREAASLAMATALTEKKMAANLVEELGNAKVQLQKSSETIGSLEHRVARMEVESERLKAELSKTQLDLARSGLEVEREKRGQQEARRDLTLLREFVHRTHRLDIPTRRGIKAMLANGSRLTVFLAFLLPLCVFAQFPPPILRGVYTTNTATWANTNVISLSTTNATSKPLTNRYRDGVLTLFGLEAGANVTLAHNGSNIVITGSGAGLTTNANQFLGVPLSIRTGAFLTNGNWFGNFTNQAGDIYLSGDGSIYINDLLSLHNGISPELSVGSVSYNTVSLVTVGGNVVALDGSASTPVFFPSGDGVIDIGYPTLRWKEFWLKEDAYIGGHVEATQYILTNQPGLDRNILMYNTNGQGYTAFSGPTNQWIPTNRFFFFITNAQPGQSFKFLSVSYAGGVASVVVTNDFFQPSSAALSNFTGTVGNNVTNVVSLSTSNATSKPITNRYDAGVLTLFGLEAGANVTLGVNASNITVSASSGGGNTNGSLPLFVNNGKPALTNHPSFEGAFLADELLFPRTNTAGTDIALSANWSFTVPTDYATNTATVRIVHSITATNGPNSSNVVWRASFLHAENGSTTDLRVGSFGTALLVTNTWAACFNCTNQAAINTIAFTNISGLSPGGLGILKLERVSTFDTYVGAASLIGLQIDYGK